MTTTLEDDEDSAKIELTTKFMKPVAQTRLHASAMVVQRTRRLGFVECDVTDDIGQLIARGYGTCAVHRASEAPTSETSKLH